MALNWHQQPLVDKGEAAGKNRSQGVIPWLPQSWTQQGQGHSRQSRPREHQGPLFTFSAGVRTIKLVPGLGKLPKAPPSLRK